MREGKVETTPRNRAPELPSWGAWLWGSAIAEPRIHEGRGSASRPPRARGPPAGSPVSPLLTISLDVSPCLDDQTTSDSHHTSDVASVSNIASQRFENRDDTTSVP